MLTFLELAPSPNSTKVRMALRYKDIPFQAVDVNPLDRASVLEVSGQELTPVIQDRGITLNDSEAILQYLDANYRDTPRLFPSDRAGRQACDAWKTEVDRKVARPWFPLFAHVLGRGEDPGAGAVTAFHEGLAWLQQALDGDGIPEAGRTGCQLRAAQWITYALPGPELLSRVPLFGKFQKRFAVAPGQFPGLESMVKPWNQRLA